MAELTQEQLLLLDNLMYLQVITDPKYKTVEELIDAFEEKEINLNNSNLSGGFEKNIDQMEKVLEAIKEDPELMALGIDASTSPVDYENYEGCEVVRATCFTQYDEAGNVAGHVVAFRGTGGIYDAWKDNFEGLYETDTEV